MKLSHVNIPPVTAVLLSILSVQGGAAMAKGLFPLLGPAGTASIRIGFSALILMLFVRPDLRKLNKAQWRAIVPYGLVLGAMNLLFYLSLARIPMGLAVSLEFIGPLVLALTGSRKVVDIIWVILAAVGIALIAPWSGTGTDVLGCVYALLAGACWAAYILLSKPAGRLLPGSLAVAVGMMFAALIAVPYGIAEGNLWSLSGTTILAAIAVAVLSSVLPYSLEMQALRSMRARIFSILMSLEPAVAALAGWTLLNEELYVYQWIAVVCIVIASIGAATTARNNGLKTKEEAHADSRI